MRCDGCPFKDNCEKSPCSDSAVSDTYIFEDDLPDLPTGGSTTPPTTKDLENKRIRETYRSSTSL